MSAYGALAASYDGLMAGGAYRRRAAFLERRLKKSPIPVETVLDLGCGTGTIACLLAKKGYQVLAADGSEEMLTQAAAKAAGLERPPLFLHQAMPRLRLAQPADAVVSTLDSLNYLTAERDLKETFRHVRRWLKPGGLFLFDVNTPYKLRRMDGQLCTYQVDLFRLRPDGAWDRSFEEHRERAWSEEFLRKELLAAGFSGLRLTGDLTDKPPGPSEDRWQFEAR